MDLNKKNVRTIIMLIIFTVLFIALVNNIPGITGVIGFVIGIIFPFIIGACIAFILNVPMHFFEDKIYGKVKFLKKGKRLLALVTTIITLLTVVILVISLVVPEIANTMKIIIAGIPKAANDVTEFVKKFGNDNEKIFQLISDFSIDWKKFLEEFSGVLKTGIQGIFSSAVGILSGTIGILFDSFVAIVFSIYILFQKEKLAKQGKQVMYAYFPENVADKIIYILKLSYKTFKNFVTGQCTEAVILGVMFFVSMNILRMPYSLLISMLIALTALIPIFGAFIGCFVGAFLILFVNPVQAVWFVIMFLVLQQIEGNLIYPHVVGNSVGLPSIWVLVAVTIGGSLWGIGGMLLFIPLSSVIYSIFKENVKNRLKKKNIPESKLTWNDKVNEPEPKKTTMVLEKEENIPKKKNRNNIKA